MAEKKQISLSVIPTSELEKLRKKIACKNFPVLENVRLNKKNSASDSIIIFGNFEYNNSLLPIVIKFTFKSKDPLDNSLLVEEQIYSNVISDLLANNITPHIVPYIVSLRGCDFVISSGIPKNWNNEAKTQFRFEYDQISKTKKYDMSSVTMIISSQTQGLTLEKFLSTPHSESSIVGIIFQILYTLYCFALKGLRHNDLHFGNIFIDKNTETETYTYKINKRIIELKCNYHARIYDFDRGSIYHPAVERNFKLDTIFCQEFNECNGINTKIDLFSFISGLILYWNSMPLIIRKWIDRITSKKFRDDRVEDRINALEFKNNYYYQIWFPNREYKNDDLNSIKECMKKLCDDIKAYIEIPDPEKGMYDSVYELPSKYKRFIGKPTSRENHDSKLVELINAPEKKRFDEIILLINNEYIKPELYLMYDTEFLIYTGGKYNILKTAGKLFWKFLEKKFISIKFYDIYYIACILLSLPFFYNIKRNDTKIAFIRLFFPKININDEINSIIDDIWNVFNNTLEIEMPILDDR
jgi:hypothetical protein